jgi:hypothetical protein
MSSAYCQIMAAVGTAATARLIATKASEVNIYRLRPCRARNSLIQEASRINRQMAQKVNGLIHQPHGNAVHCA